MLPKRARTRLYDTVQRVWVTACVSVTVVGLGYISYELYNYLKYVKPIKKEMEEKFKEELLKEGRMLHESDAAPMN